MKQQWCFYLAALGQNGNVWEKVKKQETKKVQLII